MFSSLHHSIQSNLILTCYLSATVFIVWTFIPVIFLNQNFLKTCLQLMQHGPFIWRKVLHKWFVCPQTITWQDVKVWDVKRSLLIIQRLFSHNQYEIYDIIYSIISLYNVMYKKWEWYDLFNEIFKVLFEAGPMFCIVMHSNLLILNIKWLKKEYHISIKVNTIWHIPDAIACGMYTNYGRRYMNMDECRPWYSMRYIHT